ncbi:hypothetical protein F383_18077 [Gossypium arboreum]|uniref:Uncharacterized protein n=1 Tax=Gossypium arboreum TaxID=29729 RepID=A0A0B0NKJ0_GOSAR|nr:hypothetical protein F383_18077 [Gossypium arboreum]
MRDKLGSGLLLEDQLEYMLLGSHRISIQSTRLRIDSSFSVSGVAE